MSEFVQLFWKRNRGWPSPESSWGLQSMFGDDGWCRTCGTPLRDQCGPLTLKRSGFATVSGGWVPNWRFDTVCLESSVAEKVAGRFRTDLRDVVWKGASPGAAKQIVIPTGKSAWFDAEKLRDAAEDRHGVAGAECPVCGIWRWMPLTFGLLPPLLPEVLQTDADAIASPEWFGDGCQSFRQVLFRRELAELVASASIKDLKVREVL
jgi:hypothetical protein